MNSLNLTDRNSMRQLILLIKTMLAEVKKQNNNYKKFTSNEKAIKGILKELQVCMVL